MKISKEIQEFEEIEQLIAQLDDFLAAMQEHPSTSSLGISINTPDGVMTMSRELRVFANRVLSNRLGSIFADLEALLSAERKIRARAARQAAQRIIDKADENAQVPTPPR